MSEQTVLGVHSWISAKTQKEGTAFERLTDGHAWLSVTRNGKTEYYGLWPDSHPDIVERNQNDPDKTDIRVGREANSRPTASRYYTLTPDQAAKLDLALKQDVSWGATMTCAGWASETVSDVTGRRLNATEFLSIETPRELVKTINALEAKEPTAPSQPLAPIKREPGSSDSFGALDDGARVPPAYLGLHQTSVAATQRLEAGLGRAYDANSHRLALGATVLAASEGIDRIDHIVLSRSNGIVGAGEYVFVVRGALDDPAHQRAHARTSDVLAASADQSIARLNALQQSELPPERAITEEQNRTHAPRALG